MYIEIAHKQFKENRSFIDTVNFFDNMSAGQKDSIANTIITTRYKDKENLVNKGDQADSYFIIKEGAVECVEENGKIIRVINAGETFGESALYQDTVRTLTVRAKGEVKCIALARKTLQAI